MKFFHALIAKLFGRNLSSTPKEVIIDQMNEPRPLPMGRKEFDEWCDRIISGALIPGGEDDKESFKDSLKFVLCEKIMHLSPVESHKPDGYFIHCLRKIACNEVAIAAMKEIKEKQKAKQAAKEAEVPIETEKD